MHTGRRGAGKNNESKEKRGSPMFVEASTQEAKITHRKSDLDTPFLLLVGATPENTRVARPPRLLALLYTRLCIVFFRVASRRPTECAQRGIRWFAIGFDFRYAITRSTSTPIRKCREGQESVGSDRDRTVFVGRNNT